MAEIIQLFYPGRKLNKNLARVPNKCQHKMNCTEIAT